MKLEKIYWNNCGEKELRGYKLGDLYLLKQYTWGNKYSWVISKEYFLHIGSYEIGKLYDEGKIIFVDSCKEGKEYLLNNYQLG